MLRGSPLRRALGALLLAVAAPVPAAVSDAPLGVGTPGLFQALFLDMPLADARPREAPAVDLRWWMANSWSVPTILERAGRTVSLQGDAQTDTLQLAVALPWRRVAGDGWARRVATTVELRLLDHWGGWTDRPIEAWHRLTRRWNFRRERYERDGVVLSLHEPGRAGLAEVGSPRLALGDVALRTSVSLAARGALAFALRVDVKVPIGRLARLGGSGGWDAGLGLAGTLAPRPWLTVHGLLGLRVLSGLPGGFPLQPRRIQGAADVSVVARVGERVALILEDRVLSPLVEGGWHLPAGTKEPDATAFYSLLRMQNQVSGGVRVDGLTIFFSEDFTPGRPLPTDPGPRWFYNSNAPDLVFGATWERLF